ncbi:MAG: hypothetical protein BAJATHORv1_30143 [Candidatus Thorarchaeota archaeon]|nr:MAG: hypothetical protein BAJATHORv1_30143 [Candidatus Thorarchaeota archaeon]
MSDEETRRIIEEATNESLRESFTAAGRKFEEAAELLEQKGDYDEATKVFKQAAEAYEKAASRYRESKSFKNAALNMCMAGDVYSETAESDKAIKAYEIAAEDLMNASGEYLMWGEDSETAKGTALAVLSSMIYLMIGKEADAFYKARTFAAENASKLRFPDVIRLSQIPQMLESALQSVDLEAFAAAETAAVTELKAALANAKAQDFVKYVDKGLDMVRQILRGKLKVPKISATLDLPVDMTFSEQFPLRVIIKNTGEGEALSPKASWELDEGLAIVSGERNKTMPVLPSGEVMEMEIIVKAAEELEGIKEYSVMVRGSYQDKLKTEYSLQAGPGTLILKDFKESEKLLHDLDVTGGRVGLLSSSVDESDLEKEPLIRIISGLQNILQRARTEIESSEIEHGKARIKVVNETVDLMDEIVGDEALSDKLTLARETSKKKFALSNILPLKEKVSESIAQVQISLDGMIAESLRTWDARAEQKKSLTEKILGAKSKAGDLVSTLEEIHKQVPTAAATTDPELAALRTKIRTSLDQAISRLRDLRSTIEGIAEDDVLNVGERPTTPEKVKVARESLETIESEIINIIETKKSELE